MLVSERTTAIIGGGKTHPYRERRTVKKSPEELGREVTSPSAADAGAGTDADADVGAAGAGADADAVGAGAGAGAQHRHFWASGEVLA